MSRVAPDLQAWFDTTTPSKLVPDESAYLPAAEVKELLEKHPRETTLIDLRKGDFIVSFMQCNQLGFLIFVI